MASDKSRKRVAKKYGNMPDKWDDWHVRLPDPKDQIRVIDLYHRSGSKSKSDFVRARLLGEHFKVITVDKSAVEYYRKLSELTAQVHKIGINYNQVVRFLHITGRGTTNTNPVAGAYPSDKRTHRLTRTDGEFNH